MAELNWVMVFVVVQKLQFMLPGFLENYLEDGRDFCNAFNSVEYYKHFKSDPPFCPFCVLSPLHPHNRVI